MLDSIINNAKVSLIIIFANTAELDLSCAFIVKTGSRLRAVALAPAPDPSPDPASSSVTTTSCSSVRDCASCFCGCF